MTTTAGVLTRPSVPTSLGPLATGVLVVSLLAASVAQVARMVDSPPASVPPAPAGAAAVDQLAALPMAWVANSGQSDPQVRFMAQGLGYGAFLTDTEAVVRLDGAVVRLGFAGAATTPSLTAEAPLAATVSRFEGDDPAGWQQRAATSERVRYSELWPGIDVTFRGTGSELEWDLHVGAGADPALPGLTVAGADRLELDGDRATLVIGDQQLGMGIPAVWQVREDGTRVERAAHWQLDDDVLRVVPEDWDRTLAGVVDPTLEWATYLGGGTGGEGNDEATDIAVDAGGHAYVTGRTSSWAFPTTVGAHDTTLDLPEGVFVSKLAPTGATLVYSTYVDGIGDSFDGSPGLALDGSGNAYLTATVLSTDTAFPTTPGAFDTTANGSSDAFVLKLDAGGGLGYATVLGGSGSESARDIAVDGTGAAYVIGNAGDSTFPSTPGAYDTTHNGGARDVFVAKLNPTGSALVYGTLLGSNRDDQARGIAVDSAGAVFVTGRTDNFIAPFPVTAGAFDVTPNGGSDVFVTKLNASGSGLVYGTLLGGSGYDDPGGIALTADGRAVVTGYSVDHTVDFPTTAGAFDTAHNGSNDIFATMVSPGGATLDYSTFLGGTGSDIGLGVAVDGLGHAYVTGYAQGSTNYPTTPGAYDTTFQGGPDPVVTKLDLTGGALVFSTFVGGAGTDMANAIAVDGSGQAHIAGYASSSHHSSTTTNFPTTPGAFDTTFAAGAPNSDRSDAFVTRLSATGGSLGYSTFLGGSDGSMGDTVTDVAIDASGVYVTGTAASNQFPTTAGAFDTSLSGSSDVYVTKLDPAGSTQLYSTLLGGTGDDVARGIAVDASGNAYVTGNGSTGFPTTAGAYAGTTGKPVFVTKLDPTGGALVFSTRFGGFGTTDTSNSIAVDASGSAYIAGTTELVLTGEEDQISYPTTPGALDRTYNVVSGSQSGDVEAFVTKLDPSGNDLTYSTFVGGLGFQHGADVAVDSAGHAFLTGAVTEFWEDPSQGPGTIPTTPGAFDTTYNVGYDAYVVQLNPSGSAVVYGTFLGTGSDDHGSSIAIDGAGAAYVTGNTHPDPEPFPTTPGAFDTSPNLSIDAFVTKVAPGGGSLAYSTRLGGTGADYGRGIAVDATGAAYVTGETTELGAEGFPTTGDAVDSSPNGGADAFVTKVAPNGATLAYSGFLGSAQDDDGLGIAVGAYGRVAVGGTTAGDGFPTTSGAFDTANPGLTGAGFVSVLDFSPVPAPAINGCASAPVMGAIIGWFPANPGSASGLRVACSFDNRPGNAQISPSYTVHDHRFAGYHNGAARTVTVAAAPAGEVSLTASPGIVGTGMSAWVNRVVTGPGIAPRTFVTSVDGDVLHLSRPTTVAIDADTDLLIENAPGARSIDDASGPAASTVVNSLSANFTAADVGLSIAGTGIPINATITSVNSPTQVVISAAATLTGPVVNIGATLLATTARTVTGASIPSSTTISSSAAGFAATDVGLPVSGECDQLTASSADDYEIPAGTFVLAAPTALDATTTGGLVGGSTGCTFTVGEPNATAPLDGEKAGQQGIQLDLNPAVVPGTGACAEYQHEAFVIPAQWHNPGSFEGTGLSNAQPGPTAAAPTTPGTKVIGQLYFKSSVMAFSAFVVERKASTPGDPIGIVHYDLQFPFVPTASVMCPGNNRSPGMSTSLTVHANTHSQATLAPGVGRPGTAQVRSTLPSATGGYVSTAYVRSDTAVTYGPAAAFQRICLYPTGTPNPISFQCGAG